MIVRYLLGILFLVMAGASHAQTIEVRSGEHPDFTRLVFNLPERIDYTVEKEERRIRLVFAQNGLLFDTASVFERVPRTRLEDIAIIAGESGLEIILACACETRSFWFSDTGLAFDLLNEPEQSEDRAQDPGPLDVQPVTEVSTEEMRPSSRDFARELLLDQLGIQLGQEQTALSPEESGLVLSREALLIEFGKAASQGLVDPVVPLGSVETHTTKPEEKTDEAPIPGPVPVSQPHNPNMNLRAENVFDQATRDTLREGLAPLLPPGCLPSELLDVAKWGNDAQFAVQIGSARVELVDALDQPNPSAVLKLARLYVFFGFGIEASELVENMNIAPPHGSVLSALAQIVESGQASPGSPLHHQLECTPRVAIWSALAYAELPETEPLDLDAILQGFIVLPKHLRAHLGPTLAQRLLSAGYREESERVRRIMTRNPDTAGPERQLVEVDLALAAGEDSMAGARLEHIVAANGDQSADALVRLIEAKITAREPISYDLAQLAGAYAFEHRSAPTGSALARAHLAALAASEAFDEAFSQLEDTKADYPTGEAQITAPLFDLLVQDADDFTFMKHALDDMPGRASNMLPETAFGIASRLADLGFFQAADQYLIGANLDPSSPDYRFVKARVALETGRNASAQLALSGLSGAQAIELRARGLSQAGRHEEARLLFEQVKLSSEAIREALLERNWSALIAAEIPGLSDIAVRRNAPEVAPAESPPLTSGLAMIEESSETRHSLEQMLQVFKVDETPE